MQVSDDVRSDIRAFIGAAKTNWESTILDIEASFGDLDPEVYDEPVAMMLTVSTKDGSTWSYQTGDNSYTGSCYGDPHWAVVYIGPDDINDRGALGDIANDIVDQLDELLAQSEPDEEPACPQCNGPGVLIGTFGTVTHYRCRYCGWNFKKGTQ